MLDLKVLLITVLSAVAILTGGRAFAQPTPSPAPSPPRPPRPAITPTPPTPPEPPEIWIGGDDDSDGNAFSFAYGDMDVDALRDQAMAMAGSALAGGHLSAGTVNHFATELNLSAAQKQAIRDTADEARKQQVRAHAEMEIGEIDLRRELDADQPDESKVGAAIDKLAMVEGSARKANLLATVRIKKILTPEQRTKLETLRKAQHEQVRVHTYEYGPGVAPKAPDPRPKAKAPHAKKPDRDDEVRTFPE